MQTPNELVKNVKERIRKQQNMQDRDIDGAQNTNLGHVDVRQFGADGQVFLGRQELERLEMGLAEALLKVWLEGCLLLDMHILVKVLK
jgi:hypothetical protein